ncbi:hypothetical protein L484_004286 [Morus notabilis]|uniref:Uncharacterized protein n=1 Tax=Morus notabilis TaxID=981085 RepID=W9QS42_9ROSA|nr:hypothetical protein L484_004286 [Morus notabilis]
MPNGSSPSPHLGQVVDTSIPCRLRETITWDNRMKGPLLKKFLILLGKFNLPSLFHDHMFEQVHRLQLHCQPVPTLHRVETFSIIMLNQGVISLMISQLDAKDELLINIEFESNDVANAVNSKAKESPKPKTQNNNDDDDDDEEDEVKVVIHCASLFELKELSNLCDDEVGFEGAGFLTVGGTTLPNPVPV